MCNEEGLWDHVPRCIKGSYLIFIFEKMENQKYLNLIKIDDKPIQKPTCSILSIPNNEILSKENLIIMDMHCSNYSSKSENCLPKISYILYTCEKGFIFENNKNSFYSTCKEDGGWTHVPRCIKRMN